MKTKWTEIELFWLSTAKRLDEEQTLKALDEYRRTGGMVDVVMAEPDSTDLSAEECDRLSEAGPKSDEIDWTGFATALELDRLTDDRIATLRDNAGSAGDLEQVAICNRALEGDEPARAECARVIADARAAKHEDADKTLTRLGRATDRRYRLDGETDEGLIADGVREDVGDEARRLGVVGAWDSETLTWTTAS